MQVNISALLLAAWGTISAFLGIFIGQYLVRSAQRKQWFVDNKVKEWRELLVTLRSSFITIAAASPTVAQTPEMMKDALRAHFAAHEVLGNRLFIGDEVRKREIQEKWTQAVDAVKKDQDATAFGKRFGEIQHLIEEGARAEISKV